MVFSDFLFENMILRKDVSEIWKNKVTKKRIILFENLKRQISLIL